jgi:hypothetical protein
MCNQCLSPLKLWVWIPLTQGVLDKTLCNNICQWIATGAWFTPDTPVSSTNKTDCHDIVEILLKVMLNAINHKPTKIDFPFVHIPFYAEIPLNDVVWKLKGPNILII